MLILARKLGETLIIGGDIVIRVVELRRSRVRIGIDAPAHVRIRRNEHLLRAENPEGERVEADRAVLGDTAETAEIEPYFEIDLPIEATADLEIGEELLLESASAIH